VWVDGNGEARAGRHQQGQRGEGGREGGTYLCLSGEEGGGNGGLAGSAVAVEYMYACMYLYVLYVCTCINV